MLIDKWTPNRLKIKTVKVSILGIHQVEKVDSYFVLAVCIWAHSFVAAVVYVIWIKLTELRLVIVWMIINLCLVMCLGARLTLLTVGIGSTQEARIRSQSSSLIHFRVIVNTGLISVYERLRTQFRLKCLKIKKHHSRCIWRKESSLSRLIHIKQV
jgi:hypothetical protein